jgi:DNA-binding IclR family transcriptional regulator
MEAESSGLADLSGLAVAIVNLLETHLKVTVASVVTATGANRNTVKAALQTLVKRGMIAQKGKGRGVYYTRLA